MAGGTIMKRCRCCVKHGGLCQLAGFSPAGSDGAREEITRVYEASLCTATFPPASGGRKKLLPAAVIALALKACCLWLLPMECFVSDQRGFYTISLDKRKISGRKPMHTKLYGLDSKLSIFRSMHTTSWIGNMQWEFEI